MSALRTFAGVAIVLTGLAAPALAQKNDLDEAPPGEPGVTRALPPPPEQTETVHPRYPLRAVLQMGLAFGLNVAWYWKDASFNKEDWELGWDWKSWKKKIVTFEAVRFDSNRFRTNAGSHTEGGTIIYLIGRGNGLGPAGSTLLASGESILWEYIGEFAEKPSINDMINNPLGGFAVGEPFYQLSEFFSHGARNPVNQTLTIAFSPISATTWTDGYRPPRAPELDKLGFPADVWHRFDLYSGLAQAHWDDNTGRTESTFGARTNLNTVRGYGRPNRDHGWFGTGRLTRIDAGMSLAPQGMTASIFGTHVSLAGFYAQDLSLDQHGRMVGNALLFSLVNSFEYTGRSRPGLPYDNIASFGVLGPTLDLSRRQGAVEATLHLEAVPDLGMVTSLPAARFKARYGTEGLKSELAERGYYYAYGLLLGSALELRYRMFDLGGAARWEGYGSVDTADRYQERLTRNYHQTDTRLRSQLWFEVRPRDGLFNVGLGLEHTQRAGNLYDVSQSLTERRATITFGFVL